MDAPSRRFFVFFVFVVGVAEVAVLIGITIVGVDEVAIVVVVVVAFVDDAVVIIIIVVNIAGEVNFFVIVVDEIGFGAGVVVGIDVRIGWIAVVDFVRMVAGNRHFDVTRWHANRSRIIISAVIGWSREGDDIELLRLLLRALLRVIILRLHLVIWLVLLRREGK